MVNIRKFQTLFTFFSKKMLVIRTSGSVVIRTVIHKMLVRIANMEDPVRLLFYKQSDLGLQCLSRIFWQITSVRNFRTFTYFKDNETNF